MKRLFTYLLFCLPVMLVSQRNTDTTVFEYQTKGQLPIANSLKIRENPVYTDTSKLAPEMKYGIVSRPVSPPISLQSIKAAKMEGEPLKKLYSFLVRAGMGTYTTPYLELRYDQLRSKQSSFGLHFKHLSSSATLKDLGYAGWNDEVLEGRYKYFLKRHSISSRLGYERNGLHYYGYDAVRDSLESTFYKQTFDRLGLGVSLQSHYSDSSKFNHRVSVEVDGLQDRFGVRESRVFFQTHLGREYEGHFFGGNFKVDHLSANLDFIDTSRNTLISLDPYVQFIGRNFRGKLGAAFTAELSERNSFRLYPSLEIQYHFADHILVPYAGVGGGTERISYGSISKENPFVEHETAFNLRNTNTRFELYAGFRGALSSTVSYDLKGAYRRIRDQFFYVPDTLLGIPDAFEYLENRFKLVYDTVGQFQFNGTLRFLKGEKVSLILRGEYNLVSPETEKHAWHTPNFKVEAMIRYSLRDKIIIDLNAFYRSSQLAPVHANEGVNGVEKLRAYADVNLLLQYRYNKRLGFFLNGYNLGSGRYYRWVNYPTQKLVVMGGVSLSF